MSDDEDEDEGALARVEPPLLRFTGKSHPRPLPSLYAGNDNGDDKRITKLEGC